jgi:hypothetical protein
VGEIFSIPVVDGTTIDLELLKSEPYALKPFDGRSRGNSGFVRTDPFSLLFTGPWDTMLGQGVYTFNHDVIGNFAMNIVPVGPGEKGWLYEAVFN